MAIRTLVQTSSTSSEVLKRARAEAVLLPMLVMSVVLWQVGSHVDAWYHFHYGFEIESFVTWSHAFLYAGWAASFALAAWRAIGILDARGRLQPWPPGARLMLLGTALFGVGGIFDAAWHAAFGFEVNLAALLSPSHDWLLIAAVISVAGLLQATLAWRQQLEAVSRFVHWADVLVIASLGLLLRATLWVFFYSDPLAIDYASAGHQANRLYGYAEIDWTNMAAQTAGTTGILVHSLIVGLFVAVGLYRLRLPSGALTAVLLWNAVVTAATTDEWLYVPSVLVGALAGETIWWRARRAGMQHAIGTGTAIWLTSVVIPLVQFSCYMLLGQLFGGGLAWTPHLSAGAPVLAGLFGLIGAMVAAPPAWLMAQRSAPTNT